MTSQSKPSWNPYYLAYCKRKGNEPEKQLEIDRDKYPGGCMCGFILWIDKMKRKFYSEKPDCFLSRDLIHDHKEWGTFLEEEGNK